MSKSASQGMSTQILHGFQELENKGRTDIELLELSRLDYGYSANAYGIEEIKNFCLKLADPQRNLLEERLKLIETGYSAQTFASGNAAILQTVLNICESGDNLLAAKHLYGSNQSLFNSALEQFNIEVRCIDPCDLESIEKSFDERTRLLFVETLSHPSLQPSPIAQIAELAKQKKLPLVVDSSFTPPPLLRPIEEGANIVIHALNMYYNSHSNLAGGVVIDAGNFDWSDEKFSLYQQAHKQYFGLRFGLDLGAGSHLAFMLRLRSVAMRSMAAALPPHSAQNFIDTLKTLELRCQKQSENAYQLANYLKEHSRIRRVFYPSFYQEATPSLKHYGGALLNFELKASGEQSRLFPSLLKIFSHGDGLTNVRSLAFHPASSSYPDEDETEVYTLDASANLICLSVGIEDKDELLADLQQALEKLE